MEDVLTEIPPPSRFFQEDLNNFISPSPPLPTPFFVFSKPKLDGPLRPSLLIIALSSPSLFIFDQIPSKNLIGTLILPEIALSGISVEPSRGDKSCNIYAIDDAADNSILLVTVQCPVAAERCHLIAKMLIGQCILAERVLIFTSIQSQNFRGKLSPDETFAFKLETSPERSSADTGSGHSSLLKGLDYFPSGSMIDGLAAALLGRCEMMNIRGALCVSWPEFDGSVVAMIKSILHRNVLPHFRFRLNCDGGEQLSRSTLYKDQPLDPELYT